MVDSISLFYLQIPSYDAVYETIPNQKAGAQHDTTGSEDREHIILIDAYSKVRNPTVRPQLEQLTALAPEQAGSASHSTQPSSDATSTEGTAGDIQVCICILT